LREAVKEFRISLLTYNITSNHTHMFLRAKDAKSISAFMQKLEGEFAEYYNLRKKKRSGAFWGGRYWCTMVETGQYVRNCMKYIDLNMVRAGVVRHPRDWEWCGYRELVGERQRYGLLDMGEVLNLLEYESVEDLRAGYRRTIREAIKQRVLSREPWWTESIAVGRETFVRNVGEDTRNRIELFYEETGPSQWTVREKHAAYSRFSSPEIERKA
jgi:putative transposase